MHILLVEDDPRIAATLARGLAEQDHAIDLARDGRRADELVRSQSYDAVVLDVMLPGKDGLALCSEWRRDGFHVPILMLTARDAIADRVRGLDVGADDYLVKPFAFDELLARLRALTRRGPAQRGANVMRHAGVALDLLTRRVTLHERAIELSATEYRLLEFFLRRVGATVTREEIVAHVWGTDEPPNSNLTDVYVGYLRRKLHDDKRRPLVHTVRGVGYRFGASEEPAL